MKAGSIGYLAMAFTNFLNAACGVVRESKGLATSPGEDPVDAEIAKAMNEVARNNTVFSGRKGKMALRSFIGVAQYQAWVSWFDRNK